jgi:hypothetical protein
MLTSAIVMGFFLFLRDDGICKLRSENRFVGVVWKMLRRLKLHRRLKLQHPVSNTEVIDTGVQERDNVSACDNRNEAF